MSLIVRSGVQTYDPSLVPSYVSATTISQCFQVAIMTILVYDTITTMDKEVRYFWGSFGNSVNIVYFANKYIGILGAASSLVGSAYNLNVLQCKFAAWTQSLTILSTIVLIDYILMMRVLAFYSRDKRLSICLKALLITEAAVRLGIVIYGSVAESVDVFGLAKGVTVCGADYSLPIILGLVDWIVPIIYGLILMALALYKAAEYWGMSAGFKGFPLVRVLIQDQVIYFSLAIFSCVLNLLSFKITASIPLDIVTSVGNPSFLCILGSRMLVNLKEAAEQGLSEGTSYRMTSRTVSAMEFS